MAAVPLIERKAQLRRILPESMSGRLRYTDHVVEQGLELFAAIEAQQLEGMVAKRADSLYVSGKSREWLKIKTIAGREEMKRRIETWDIVDSARTIDMAQPRLISWMPISVTTTGLLSSPRYPGITKNPLLRDKRRILPGSKRGFRIRSHRARWQKKAPHNHQPAWAFPFLRPHWRLLRLQRLQPLSTLSPGSIALSVALN